jgi:putative membrane-bound dehydrogenase-like protein
MRILSSLSALVLAASALAAPVPLFDGKSFDGWEGDTEKTWRIKDGAIVGGSLTEKVPRNEFLATKKTFKNFDLKLKFKLVGTEGFVNSGVQIRSVRIPNPPNEMRGYQADIGDPKWWGSIYDESRRNKVMAQSDMAKIEPVLKRQDWNDYRIRAVGRRIQIWINGVQAVDYTEADETLEQDGHIAVQVHGGGKAEVWFKDIAIEELPADAKPETAEAGKEARRSEAVDRPGRPASPPTASATAQTPATPAGVPAKRADGRDLSYNAEQAVPLTAEEERASFRLPEGFVAELVADESVMAKAVAFNFDNAGRMWVTTASEYPLDANEQPELAERLYREGGKDAVLIFDTPWAKGLQKPRVWAGQPPETGERKPETGEAADNAPVGAAASSFSGIRSPVSGIKLAMPMGVLPYKDGAIVQHGPDLLFLRDTDNDGVADKKEVLLTGFGIQDSHLMPHGFTRGPGDWIYFAQGAFNTSVVKTKEGTEVTAKHCKLMRMKPDGTKFEVVGWGLNNIWGFVIDPRGEMWVQEANDMGYPVAPFQLGMAYPGIGSDKPKPYAPFMPPPRKLNDCTMGGTGLSGLALNEDPETWPAPWTGAFMVANPITNKIQAMRVHREVSDPSAMNQRKLVSLSDTSSTSYDDIVLEKLPDFLVSDDKSFRPVAIQFGPDGSLYVIDWYNKIISHNEVPRSHPERDKTRTRIWRIRAEVPASSSPLSPRTASNGREVPDPTKFSVEQLGGGLGTINQWQANAARAEMIDRRGPTKYRGLKQLLEDRSAPPRARLNSLWALQSRGEITPTELATLIATERGILRSAAILAAAEAEDPSAVLEYVEKNLSAVLPENGSPLLAMLERLSVRPELQQPILSIGLATPRASGTSQSAFDAQLLRAAFARYPSGLNRQLAERIAGDSQPHAIENWILASLALPEQEGAPVLTQLLPRLQRPLRPDEIGLLGRHIQQPAILQAFTRMLNLPEQQLPTLEAITAMPPVQNRQLAEMIVTSVKSLADRDPSEKARRLVMRVAKAHRLAALEPYVLPFASDDDRTPKDRIEAINTLREIGSNQVDLFARLAKSTGSKEAEEIRREAINALASSIDDKAVPALAEMWPQLSTALRKLALDKVASSKAQAQILVKLVKSGGPISLDQLDDVAIDKLVSVLGAEDPDLTALLGDIKGAMQPVVRLTGDKGDLVETRLDLAGPFTVEAWVRMDPGVSNEDVLLGSPAGPNFNFFDGRLRVYAGAGVHDALIAKTPMKPNMWTHVAITRNGDGQFRIYQNGELDAEGGKAWKEPFTAMDIGRNSLPKGTGMALTELRFWVSERSADQIRAGYQRSIADEPVPEDLKLAITASADQRIAFVPKPPKMTGQAKVVRTRDFPELLTAAATRALEEKFARFRNIVAQPGDAATGRTLFAGMCAACHRVKGEGGHIGPDLSGAGAMGNEALLRNILTPNAQLESGYYRYDVQLKNGDLITGFLVKEESDSIIIRPIGGDDRSIARSDLTLARFTRKSLMPEGLIEALPPDSVRDLFAYLNTLK